MPAWDDEQERTSRRLLCEEKAEVSERIDGCVQVHEEVPAAERRAAADESKARLEFAGGDGRGPVRTGDLSGVSRVL